jgi:uncharacterized protein
LITQGKKGVLLTLRVSPNAAANSISTERPDALMVKLTTPPVEGRANKDAIKLLAKKLGIAASKIELVRGKTSRDKVVLISGLDIETVKNKLGIG